LLAADRLFFFFAAVLLLFPCPCAKDAILIAKEIATKILTIIKLFK
jgi:hypothetical protein